MWCRPVGCQELSQLCPEVLPFCFGNLQGLRQASILSFNLPIRLGAIME